MKNRYLARLAMLKVACLSLLVGGLSGCAIRQGDRVITTDSRLAASVPVAKQTRVRTRVVAMPKATATQTSGILTEVEPPKIESVTKFADAESAADSPQTRSMREQMARRYGCCGR
jgi:hypothetical protein